MEFVGFSVVFVLEVGEELGGVVLALEGCDGVAVFGDLVGHGLSLAVRRRASPIPKSPYVVPGDVTVFGTIARPRA